MRTLESPTPILVLMAQAQDLPSAYPLLCSCRQTRMERNPMVEHLFRRGRRRLQETIWIDASSSRRFAQAFPVTTDHTLYAHALDSHTVPPQFLSFRTPHRIRAQLPVSHDECRPVHPRSSRRRRRLSCRIPRPLEGALGREVWQACVVHFAGAWKSQYHWRTS